MHSLMEGQETEIAVAREDSRVAAAAAAAAAADVVVALVAGWC